MSDTPGDCPLDMVWLEECTDGDRDAMKSILELFFDRTTKLLVDLDTAVKAGKATEIRHIAHACAGSSGSCGFTVLAQHFRDLEKMGIENNLAGAADKAAKITAEYERGRIYVKEAGLI